MQLSELTPTHLKRFNSAIYSVKELIQIQKVDGYDHLVDTLMMAYYGIETIVQDMEQLQREEHIKRYEEYKTKQH